MFYLIFFGAVLAIGAGILIYGLFFVHHTQQGQKVTDFMTGVSNTLTTVQHNYGSSSTGYTNIKLSDLIALGAFPSSWVKGTVVEDPWGGDITVSSSTPTEWTMTAAGIPKTACNSIGSSGQISNIVSMAINSKSLTPPISVANVTAACTTTGQGPTGGNSVAFTFY